MYVNIYTLIHNVFTMTYYVIKWKCPTVEIDLAL